MDRTQAVPGKLDIKREKKTFACGEIEIVSLEVDPAVYGVHVAVQIELHDRMGVDRNTETFFYISDDGQKVTDMGEIIKHINTDEDTIRSFESAHNSEQLAAAIDNCSLFFNQGFATYVKGKIFHTHGEDVEKRSYSSLIITAKGEIRMQEVTYRKTPNEDVNIYAEGVKDEIVYATYGQFLLDGNGSPRSDMESVIPHFQDLRHVFRLPEMSLPQVLEISPEALVGRERKYYGVYQLAADSYALAKKAWSEPVALELSIRVDFKDGEKTVSIPQGAMREKLISIGYEEFNEGPLTEKGTFNFSNGKLNIFLGPGIYPRTIVGVTSENKLKIIGACISGKSGLKGITLEESARLSSDMGLKQAMLLDHGGSAKIYANGEYVLPSSEGRYFRTSALVITTHT